MSLIQSSIRYPVTVIVGVLIAFLGGLLALSKVPVQLTPQVTLPVINVATAWPGASPEEIEREIIEEQEDFLKSVEGVQEMSSEAHDGYGTVRLEFAAGTDLTGATVRVSNKLDQVPSYPENALRPVVSSTGRFDNAIAWFVVRALDDSLQPAEWVTFLEDTVKPELERVEGVAGVNFFGGISQELHVSFDPDRLASTGITVTQLANALRAENRDTSAGDFSEGKRRYLVRTISRFENPEQVTQTVVKVLGGVPIRVGDVAEVEVAFQKPGAIVRYMGEPAIAFNVQRRIGANVLDVTEALLAEVEPLNERILRPRGLELQNVYRQTRYIEASIKRVYQNLLLGAILAVAVLFLFLRSARAIVVIGVSIPISVVTTFLSMYLLGRTINVISLAGMAFAVGMVVDNAIVVLENIYRHLQMGKKRLEAALDGTTEVWGAVLASTLTTVAVFLPIVFIEERAGQLFRDIAIAISSAIIVSLVVAVTVIPAASAKILSASRRLTGDSSRLDRFAARISSVVDRLNESSFRRLATILTVVVTTVGLSITLLPSSEYLPNGNQNFIFAMLIPPSGYNLNELVDIGKGIEEKLSYLWTEGGDQIEGGGVDNFWFVAMHEISFVGIRARDPSRVTELLPVANETLLSVPGAMGFANQSSIFAQGFSSTRSVRIDITGPALDEVLSIARNVFGQIGQVLPNTRSRPIPGLDLGNPEVRIYPDRVRAADMGLSGSEIGRTVNALVDGMKVSEYFHEGREVDLVLKGMDGWSETTQSIEQLPIATSKNQVVTLGDLAEVRQAQGPVQINHVERQRAVSIETVLNDDIALEDAIQAIENEIIAPMRSDGRLSELYDIRLRGAADDLSRLRAALGTNFIVVLLLTFLLLAALFQSFLYPIVIMLTVPLATFGGVLGLRTVQMFDSTQQLDILTMLGFVILVGTVINNSILIVYQALRNMRAGADSREAVRNSVQVRVRPIFMSTMTSMLGMLPLVVMPGPGSELYRGLGSVVVGGLLVSTFITLVLTPLVFSLAVEVQEKVRSRWAAEAEPEPGL